MAAQCRVLEITITKTLVVTLKIFVRATASSDSDTAAVPDKSLHDSNGLREVGIVSAEMVFPVSIRSNNRVPGGPVMPSICGLTGFSSCLGGHRPWAMQDNFGVQVFQAMPNVVRVVRAVPRRYGKTRVEFHGD